MINFTHSTASMHRRFKVGSKLDLNSAVKSGFALIATISVMVLLVMIALAMLSLSTIESRSSQNGRAMAEAQGNARMALMLAIGELQKSMGPDQRVSANGDILSDPASAVSTVNHPHWAGVWNSWKAGTQTGSTNPDTASEHRTIDGASNTGMHPTYEEDREDHFRSWLVSLDPAEAAAASSAKDLILDGVVKPVSETAAVQLVGAGSLGPDSLPQDHVSARLLDVVRSDSSGNTSKGRYGWWVGDESQKARLMDDSYQLSDAPENLAESIFRHQAPASTGTTTVKGLEDMTDEQQEKLDALQSRRTLDLVDGTTDEAAENFHHVTPFSYQVLADVREGGLKRCLTTLLDRNIDRNDVFNTSQYKNISWKADADDYMLYKFNTKDSWSVTRGQEMVSIHDLAAYYQMYDEGNRLGHGNYGVKYRSQQVRDGIQLATADYGTKGYLDQYMRQYSSLYRNPVPIKVQFLMSMTAEPRSSNLITAASPYTHKLHLGITPSITLWNPTNLPLVMNFGDDPNRYAQMFRLMNLPINIRWNKNDGEYRSSSGIDMNWAAQNGQGKPNIFSLYLSGTRPITFEPGEVKVLSLPYRPGNMAFRKTDRFVERHEVASGWDPSAFLELHRSDKNNSPPHSDGSTLLFKATDKISVEITADAPVYTGAAMAFFMIQASHQKHGNPGTWHFRQYFQMSRVGKGAINSAFNNTLMTKGFPGGVPRIITQERSGSEIISRAADQEVWPFMQFALMAGTETSETSNGGALGGRKFASRPFLHSTAISPSNIDRGDEDSFYNYGWNWWIQEINSVLEANVQVSEDNQGYYGGGYTPESGTTHVVQQEVPIVAPMSIASLSHAHLGGFSLAVDAAAGEGADGTAGYYGLIDPYRRQSYHRVTAAGQGGMFPHTLQAIGNSYAHPHISANKAYENWSRTFSADAGARQLKIVDHSYLANKALWDDYFFSSISKTPRRQKIFGVRRDVTAKTAATKFFFDDEPLPNRRMVPYKNQLDFGKFNTLFTTAQQQLFTDGLADKIASYLMVEGAFNVNSTSVEAWKVFLSSLKGKKVSYLDKDTALTAGVSLQEETPEGTPVSGFTLPNGKATKGSTKDPSSPDQWVGWRELSDTEIEELATAMVKQVKLRGPFLSLSEFINRRLDSSEKALSVKGALQAALDDDDVSINEGFRSANRKFKQAEISKMNPKFAEALEGPIAYGSSAYVDQADVLRNFAGQLTPRGDTFVIRTYGDSLDSGGKVRARAWCEAVVQRVPDYLDSKDDSHLKQADLTSDVNKAFGRKLRIVSFRWMSDSEI